MESDTEKINELMETGLFKKETVIFMPQLHLLNTDYVLQQYAYATQRWRWVYRPSYRLTTLEEVFNRAQPEIIEKLVYHLDILPR